MIMVVHKHIAIYSDTVSFGVNSDDIQQLSKVSSIIENVSLFVPTRGYMIKPIGKFYSKRPRHENIITHQWGQAEKYENDSYSYVTYNKLNNEPVYGNLYFTHFTQFSYFSA